MIKIVQSLNEPNVFYLWSDTYLIIVSVKFIPFTFSPCEPRLLRKNQLAELIVKEKTDQEATFKQPIFSPPLLSHWCALHMDANPPYF